MATLVTCIFKFCVNNDMMDIINFTSYNTRCVYEIMREEAHAGTSSSDRAHLEFTDVSVQQVSLSPLDVFYRPFFP